MGTPTGSPATSDWPAARTSPCTAATSVEVPPMSKERIFRNPLRPATAAAPTNPPTGPDNTVRTGSRAARFQRRNPAARLHDKDARDKDARVSRDRRPLRQPFHIGLHKRLQISVHHGRARAFVFPKLRQNPMRHRKRLAKFRHGRSYSRFVLRVGEGEEQRNSDGVWLGKPHRLPQPRQLRVRRTLQDPALGIRPLPNAESQFSRDERRNPIKEEIIQTRTCLPPNLDDVFKSRSCNQRNATAFSLQQSVGPDGRAVQQSEHGSNLLYSCAGSYSSFVNPSQRLPNRARRIIRS